MPIYKMDGKKQGKQKYRVRINYIDTLGKSKQIDRVAYGKDEAKLLEIELTKNLKEETVNRVITVRQLFDEYMKVHKNEVRESSYDKSSRVIEYHIMPELENVKLNKLTVSMLQNWKTSMENKVIKGKEEKLSLTTKQNAFGELRDC